MDDFYINTKGTPCARIFQPHEPTEPRVWVQSDFYSSNWSSRLPWVCQCLAQILLSRFGCPWCVSTLNPTHRDDPSPHYGDLARRPLHHVQVHAVKAEVVCESLGKHYTSYRWNRVFGIMCPLYRVLLYDSAGSLSSAVEVGD